MQRLFKNEWTPIDHFADSSNTSRKQQLASSNNTENEQETDKVLNLKQDHQYQRTGAQSSKKNKLDTKQQQQQQQQQEVADQQNSLLKTLLLNQSATQGDMSQLNQQLQLNWLLAAQRNPLSTNKLAQNTTTNPTNTPAATHPLNLTQASNFGNENLTNCLNTLFNSSNMLAAAQQQQQQTASQNNPLNQYLSYQMSAKSPLASFNPFSNALLNSGNSSSGGNAETVPSQAEMMFPSKKLFEIINCINMMSSTNATTNSNPMNMNPIQAAAAAAFFTNQFKNADSGLASSMEANNAAQQQLNLALSSMSNAAAGL